MIIIKHRVNSLKDLAETNHNNGIEVDIRYHNNDIICCHDAFNHQTTNPIKLTELLQKWQHSGPIILNLKTTGVENECAAIMHNYKIKSWFFLDMAMPTFIWHTRIKQKSKFNHANIALRCSEYESAAAAISYREHASWIWLDCFSGNPNINSISTLQQAGFKICVVSPELQSYSKETIFNFRCQLKNIKIDAVCTKHPKLWQSKITHPDHNQI